MERAIALWRAQHEPCTAETLTFLKILQKSYVVYGDMLLLPSTAYAIETAHGHHESLGIQPEGLDKLYTTIARHMKITHIATTRPIPLSSQDGQYTRDNVLRSPSGFQPLYGDFGPSTCADPPTVEDFNAAYWVTAKQNGIYQTWAPRWTMFSRGNVSEKARLLTLPSVLSAVADDKVRGCAAVDLYAGIGYFTFSYLKAGVSKVLCWDLNPWSTEGLMRGAKANKWKAERVDDASVLEVAKWCEDDDVRALVLNDDNTKAGVVIEHVRSSLPPIRHVNCGLLPTSKGSWETAVQVLDDGYDGWLHVHENFAVAEIAEKTDEVREEIEQLVVERMMSRCGQESVERRLVKVDHVNRLKSYAPGVMHCVLDIYIPKYAPS
ncbi:S-adenosylmethionine-dependent methyltransferase [Elasticomyces elasticus]|nr:S-adenosylmethionine-dependent methyltransferase [Elasticomyces elasticus]KAK4970753.1 S-adenosylmethionine-dependent methyltransferase [Elasticomyces elasticus]